MKAYRLKKDTCSMYQLNAELMEYRGRWEQAMMNANTALRVCRNKNDVMRTRALVSKIAKCMHFENCPSHTELKINKRGVFIIETSPRLGGDHITSTLVPLSTGINMEDQLLNIALGEKVDTQTGRVEKASGVCFFCLPEGVVKRIDPQINEVASWPRVYSFELKLKEGNKVNQITSSLNRYGEFIVDAINRKELDITMEEKEKSLKTH